MWLKSREALGSVDQEVIQSEKYASRFQGTTVSQLAITRDAQACDAMPM